MKKVLFLMLLPLLIACSNEPEPTPENKGVQNINTSSLSRSIDEVMRIAEAGRDLLSEQSRSHAPQVLSSSVTAIRTSNGRSDLIDTVMYAVNYEDEKGFILISAVNCVTPIIGISDCGSFNSVEEVSNENFQFYLNAAKSYIVAETERKLSGATSQEAMTQASEGAFEIIQEKKMYPARLKTQWHQRWPENIYCPNKIAGCGPVALSQILAYEEEPASMELTFPERDKDSQIFNWSEIVKHGRTAFGDTCSVCISRGDMLYPCKADKEAHYEIGRLVRQVGHLANAQYSPNATSTYYAKLKSVARQLLPEYEITSYYNEKMFEKIKDDYKVGLVAGTDEETFEKPAGHAWVFDGAMSLFVITKRKDDPKDEGRILSQTNYIHYNWGWGGKCNGYFLDGVFDNDKAYEEPPIVLPNKAKSRYNFNTDVVYFIVY